MIADPELTEAVDEREHWQLDDHGALYTPPGAVALVRVQPVHQPTRRERYAATIVQAALRCTQYRAAPRPRRSAGPNVHV